MWSPSMMLAFLWLFAATSPELQEKFQRSVEADLALNEATELASTRPNDARKLFKYAIDLAPDDADVYLAAARFEQKQGKPEVALRYLTLGKDAAPQHPQVPYERALLLMDMKRDAEAKEAFSELRATDSRAAYWLGVYALNADDNAAAFELFGEAQKGEGETAALARSYHAILAAERGEKDARNLAAKALQTAPTPVLQQRLTLLAKGADFPVAASSQPSDRYLPWVSFRADVTAELDSNASLGAQNALQLNAVNPDNPLPVPTMGFRLTEFARFVFRPIAKESFTLEAEGNYLNANHLNNRAELARFDFGGPSAYLRFFSTFGDKLKLEFGLEGSFRDLWTNLYATHFLTGWGVVPHLALVFAPRHALYLLGAFEHRDFVDTSISPARATNSPNDRDALYWSVGLAYNLPIVSMFDISASAAYDQEQTGRKFDPNNYVAADVEQTDLTDANRGANFFLRGVRGVVGVRFNYKNMLLANAYGSINARWFPYALPLRNERRWEAGVGVRYFPIRYFGFGVTYSFTYNDADSPSADIAELFTYNRHVVGLTLTGQY